jgi:isopenicillin N synthase-like dioxygenase
MQKSQKRSNLAPVCVDYAALCAAEFDLSLVRKAFGPKGLGIILIKGVPQYSELRRKLLPLASRFATLADSVKSRYEDSASSYNVGWSCGKEMLQDGTPDVFKGSFYANPLCDVPTRDPELLRCYPQYMRPNLWPEELPELETAFKALGRLIFDVGMIVLGHCEKYISSIGGAQKALQQPMHTCIGTKGRLLCYLPPAQQSNGLRQWCGWHKDHGCLTGLTSAMYIKTHDVGSGGTSHQNEQEELACPDSNAGLYIQDRNDEIYCISIPHDCIAFQIGEALQIMSLGMLEATPHCVVPPRPESLDFQVWRNTFALFMQPRWDYSLAPGLTFGDFSAKKFKEYYQDGQGN